MKRSVAITGPTPAFVRWAIAQPCSVRPIEPDRFADQTFRCLRAAREWIIAEAEDRCLDGCCIRFDTEVTEEQDANPGTTSPASSAATDAWASRPAADSLMGFSVDEVTLPLGGADHLVATCQGCPANVIDTFDSSVARTITKIPENRNVVGCYGFLPVNEFSFDRLLSGCQAALNPRSRPSTLSGDAGRQPTVTKFDLVQAFQETQSEHPAPHCPKSVWHSFWRQRRSGSATETELTGSVLADLRDRCDQVIKSRSAVPNALRQFRDASNRCLELGLSLIAELVPAGFSDGQTWQLNPSCPECRFDFPVADLGRVRRCGGCGASVTLTAGPKFKVLGLRPYVRLAEVIGVKGTQALLDKLGKIPTVNDSCDSHGSQPRGDGTQN